MLLFISNPAVSSNPLENVANIALILITGFNAYLAFRVYRMDHNSRNKKLADTLAPIAFESKLIGNMLSHFSGNPILDSEREREYISFVMKLAIIQYQFPKELVQDVEKILELAKPFIARNRRCRQLLIQNGESEVLEQGNDGRQFREDDTQWMWDNRAEESERFLELGSEIEKYLKEACH